MQVTRTVQMPGIGEGAEASVRKAPLFLSKGQIIIIIIIVSITMTTTY